MDPLLPKDPAKYAEQLRALSGFSGRVKTGYFGYDCDIGSGSVSSAWAAIGQVISMDRIRSNPSKVDGKLLHPLKKILDGFKNGTNLQRYAKMTSAAAGRVA